MTLISVIVVSFNARVDLERCLDALRAAPPDTPHEIVVVDNASTDGSAAAARSRPGVRAIDAGSNLGFARACNIGIRASRGTHLLLLNSDTVVPAGAVDALVDELERNPDVAVVGPRLVDETGRAELSFGRMITPLAEWRQKRLARSGLVDQLTRRRHYPDWVSGACLLVSRADADAAGLLDERFFRRRRLLRGDSRARPPHPLHTEGGSRSRARPVGRDCAESNARGVPAQSSGLLRETPPGLGAHFAPLYPAAGSRPINL